MSVLRSVFTSHLVNKIQFDDAFAINNFNVFQLAVQLGVLLRLLDALTLKRKCEA